MRFSNRATRKLIGILLATSGFVLASAQFAAAQEPALLVVALEELR